MEPAASPSPAPSIDTAASVLIPTAGARRRVAQRTPAASPTACASRPFGVAQREGSTDARGRAWLARVWFNDPASQLSGWEPQTHSLGMDSRKASKQGFPFPVPRTHFNCGAREEEQTNRRGSHTERNLQIEPGGARLMAGRSRPNARTLHLSSAVDGAPPRRAPRIER
jgi:hypothetical protein